MSLRASLFKAVANGDRKSVASLLASGADVNSQNDGGQTPLILAIISGQDHILPMLSDFGADPFIRDHTGLNAIDWAERKGRIDLVKDFKKDVQPKPRVETGTPPRTNTSSNQPSSRATVDEEKSRKYIAGLRRRFEERPPARPSEPQRQRIATPEITKSTSPDRSESATTQIQSSTTLPDYETLKRVREDQPRRTDERPASDSETERTDQPVADTLQSTNEVSPTVSRAVRKRCPQCNTIYNSELLTYCAYHVVPLVDVDAPIVVRPESRRSSILLWTLVLFTLFAAALVTAYVTGLLFRSKEKHGETTASQAAYLKGIPVAKGQLAQKVVSLPVAEAPVEATQRTATVEVSIKVNRLGQVIDASSSSDNQILRESALTAAKKATFSPEKLGNRGTIGIIAYTFNR